jgi:hypothetical protein
MKTFQDIIVKMRNRCEEEKELGWFSVEIEDIEQWIEDLENIAYEENANRPPERSCSYNEVKERKIHPD